MDPQMAQVLETIQRDPAAAQQMQAEIAKMQVQQALKAQVSAVHKKCFPKCFTEVTVDRASSSQEKCLITCGKDMVKVSQLVKTEIDEMIQRNNANRMSHY